MLRLIVIPQSEAETKARELLQRLQQELSEASQQNKLIELLLEITARIFPQLSPE